MTRQILAQLDGVATAMAHIAGALFVVLSFYLTIDVVGRKFFHLSTAVSDEYGGVFYLVLGTFMDGFSMMVTTIPVILPILKTQNIDLVWFGVIATILTEAALISPPEGLNLYVIHGLRERGAEARKSTIMDVYVGVMPFFVMMIVAIILLMVFPQIALWLPTTMKGS